VFSKNRDRLIEDDIAAKFMRMVLEQPWVKRLLSADHFSVDGTLIEAWASMMSFKREDSSKEPPTEGGGRDREADFHGQQTLERYYASTTDSGTELPRVGGIPADPFLAFAACMHPD